MVILIKNHVDDHSVSDYGQYDFSAHVSNSTDFPIGTMSSYHGHNGDEPSEEETNISM